MQGNLAVLVVYRRDHDPHAFRTRGNIFAVEALRQLVRSGEELALLVVVVQPVGDLRVLDQLAGQAIGRDRLAQVDRGIAALVLALVVDQADTVRLAANRRGRGLPVQLDKQAERPRRSAAGRPAV